MNNFSDIDKLIINEYNKIDGTHKDIDYDTFFLSYLVENIDTENKTLL